MKNIISFKKNGYDPFIDYLKGICILSVVLLHSIPTTILKFLVPCLWLTMCIPIFLTIQVFHGYKKGIENTHFSLSKIFNRIVRPFIFAELYILIIYFLKNIVTNKPLYETSYLLNFIKLGGIGPGSYYVWIYIQIAILICMFAPILKYCERKQIGDSIICSFLIFLSIIFEVIFSYNENDLIYRIFVGRYIFLLYFGYKLARKTININMKTIILGLLSGFLLILYYYDPPILEPFVTDSKWNTSHWFCYFWLPIYLFLISKFYRHISHSYFQKVIMMIGKYSFEIYLVQMVWFSHFHFILPTTNNHATTSILWTIASLFFCITPVIIWKKYISPIISSVLYQN